MELIFLGTGAGVPSKERNVSALALTLLQEINSVWLFDCGEATQHQILYTSIRPRKVNKIFITHMHGDHIFGLPGFLSSRSFQGGDDLLTIYGPSGIKEFIETSLATSKTHLTYPLSIVELEEGQIYEDNHFTVFCKKLDHGVPSYGFRIEEKSKLGELQVNKLQAIGIKPGPIYKQIKENAKLILPDGNTLYREHFIGPDKPGKIISILGDTRSPEKNIDFVQSSDVLVHEATFDSQNEELAKRYYHSTTTQAAILAKESNTKKLILTHISSRFQLTDSPYLLDEARRVFSNTFLAKDFYRVEV